jgi:hypothetical protein
LLPSLQLFSYLFLLASHLPQVIGHVSAIAGAQGCWRNEGSLNRGMDRGRGLGINGPFFCDSCSNLEMYEAFQISHCSIPLAAGILHAIVGVFAGVAAILAEFMYLLLMLGPINPLKK